MIRVAVLVVGLGFAGQATAADCNGNGVDDSRDLAASFEGLGDLLGGDFMSRAGAVSADGSVVVGVSRSESGEQAFRWTRGEGMVGIGYLPGTFSSEASGVSADGSTVVGISSYPGGPWFLPIPRAFRWTAATGMEELEHLPARYYSTRPSVSADGFVIVGADCGQAAFVFLCEAYRWTSVEGIVSLGHLPGEAFDSEARAVSADGAVVVGYDDVGGSACECGGSGECPFYDSFRWTADGGMVPLGFSPSGCFGSVAYDVSADGSIVVGASPIDPTEAFRWTEKDGRTRLGDLPGGRFFSSANAVSGDGSVVVGDSDSASGREAFIWDAENGMRPLRTVLMDEYGVDLSGWSLTNARDNSEDGRSIVGYGTDPEGLTEAWIATLPFSADCNANGVPDECDQDCNANLVPDECETWVEARADIRPGACSNVVPRNGRGLLSVAILGSGGLDVSEVDLSTVRLHRAGCVGGSVAPDRGPQGIRTALKDLGSPFDGGGCSCPVQSGDGVEDLVVTFRTDDVVSGLSLQHDPPGAAVELVVTGELKDGVPFIGSDCVQWVPPAPAFKRPPRAPSK